MVRPLRQLVADGYRWFVKTRLTQGVDPTRHEQLRDVLAIGSAAFARQVRELAGAEAAGTTQRRALRRRVREATVR